MLDELTGNLHGIWIDYDDKQKATNIAPHQWPVRWVREDLKPKAVFFTKRDFSDPVSEYADPKRVFVRAVVDNNCKGHIDRLEAEVRFGAGTPPTSIELVETTPFSGEFYSDNEGIPVPSGNPGSVSVTLTHGLKGGKAELRYSGQDKSTATPTPGSADFMKSLNNRIEKFAPKKADKK